MSKILLIVLFVALCSLHAWPQAVSHVRVKGRIIDKETQQPLADATVALLYAKDSSRAAMAFTDKNGGFVLDAVMPGAYQLLITYIGYQQHLKAVNISVDTLMQLRDISLQRTGVTLGMVEIVEVRAPMIVKKDTLEFNADYYKVRENAVMEELLKKLPGVEIAPDGTIKVNGEIVKRILVDGKPFFGDDPKLAIRNLPADMIDKVQLVDRKSDQAVFTGVEDGKREKAVNITIKENMENNFLGHITGGYGTNDRFVVNGNLNQFDEQEQLSFLGGGNNINGSQDRGMQVGGYGIAHTWNGGANYSKDINKIKISGSYYVNDFSTKNEQISIRQNLLPDTTWYYNKNTHSLNNFTSHTGEVRFEIKPDSMQTIIAGTNIGYVKSYNYLENLYETRGSKQQLINNGNMHNIGSGSSPNINTNIFWGKRFKKPARTLSTSIMLGYDGNKQENFNQSDNLFIRSNGGTYGYTINQRNYINSLHRIASLNVTYTEPIYKDHFLDIAYIFNRDYASSDKLTYDYNTFKDTYDRLNDSLSNSFENISVLQRASMSFRAQKQRYDYSVGFLIQLSSLDNDNISQHNRLKRNTTGFFPVAFFNYAFSSNRRLRFQYGGNTQQPDITQLQPVPNNNNPLYIQLGNADLKPTVTHSFNLGYTAVDPSSFRGFIFNINTILVTNKIVNASWFDSLGRQVSKPLNVNGAYGINTYMTNTFPFKKKKTTITSNTVFVFNRDINYINGKPGSVKRIDAKQNLNFNYTYKKIFELGVKAEVGYNGTRYSQQKESDIDLFNYVASFNYNIQLPLGFTLNGNLEYQHNTGRAIGYNLDVTMLNAFIAKSVLPNRKGLIKVQAFDLLNQNQSFIRSAGPDYVEDVDTKILRRFFMLSFTYFLKPADNK